MLFQLVKRSLNLFPYFLLLVGGFSVNGCAVISAPRPLQSGETADVYYACRTPDGALAATNIKKMAEDPKQPKASIFVSPQSYDPLTLVVGSREECQTCPRAPGKISGFTDELHRLLATELDGWTNGQREKIQLSAEAPEDLQSDARYSRLAKVRRRPKQTRIQARRYTLMTGKEPAVGDRFASDFNLEGEITGIEGDQVDIRFNGMDGSKVDTPFGKGVLHGHNDHFSIDIQVAEGQLIRTGNAIGRVVHVDSDMFVIDYGYPLGGVELTCDVRAEAID